MASVSEIYERRERVRNCGLGGGACCAACEVGEPCEVPRDDGVAGIVGDGPCVVPDASAGVGADILDIIKDGVATGCVSSPGTPPPYATGTGLPVGEGGVGSNRPWHDPNAIEFPVPYTGPMPAPGSGTRGPAPGSGTRGPDDGLGSRPPTGTWKLITTQASPLVSYPLWETLIAQPKTNPPYGLAPSTSGGTTPAGFMWQQAVYNNQAYGLLTYQSSWWLYELVPSVTPTPPSHLPPSTSPHPMYGVGAVPVGLGTLAQLQTALQGLQGVQTGDAAAAFYASKGAGDTYLGEGNAGTTSDFDDAVDAYKAAGSAAVSATGVGGELAAADSTGTVTTFINQAISANNNLNSSAINSTKSTGTAATESDASQAQNYVTQMLQFYTQGAQAAITANQVAPPAPPPPVAPPVTPATPPGPSPTPTQVVVAPPASTNYAVPILVTAGVIGAGIVGYAMYKRYYKPSASRATTRRPSGRSAHSARTVRM
jgi:hypothetical protein